MIVSLVGIARANEDVAVVQELTPAAWAKAEGEQVALEVGTGIKEHYSLHTDVNGKLALRFNDGSDLRLSPSSSVEVTDFVFNGNDTPSFAINLLSGAVRVVSGAVVEQNPEGFKLTTPLAVVAIRGTTVEAVTTTDKDIIRVTEMGPGHTVGITSSDGRYAEISQSGMQVEIMRGQEAPLTPQPISGDAAEGLGAPDDGSGDGGGANAEMPHRDVGEQMSPLMVQQEAPLLDIVLPEPVARTTYPAFLMGLPPVANWVGDAAMSGDGHHVFYVDQGNPFNYYLWDALTGSNVLIDSLAPMTSPVTRISGDGNVLYYTSGSNDTDAHLRRMNTGLAINPVPVLAGTGMEIFALNYDGSIAAGYSVPAGTPVVTTWHYNGATYVPMDAVTPGMAAIAGRAYCLSDDGGIVAGENANYQATYWRYTGTSGSSRIYSIGSSSFTTTSQFSAITPDGSHMVGNYLDTSNYAQGFYYTTASDSYVNIPHPSGYAQNMPTVISRNGQVVAGTSLTAGAASAGAFFWRPSDPGVAYDVTSHLNSHGVNTGGVTLQGVFGISDDGSILLCLSNNITDLYLARIDGDFLGLTSPTNIYSSLSAVAGGASSLITSLPMANLPGTTFNVGNIPAAGSGEGGNTLRVWASGTFMTDSDFSNNDQGASGGAGATYFMDNGFSIGGGVHYGYRNVYGLWDSKQELENISFSLQGGYAPEVTGIRLSLGAMAQNYDLDTRRNYPNGGQIATSSGGGGNWGFGFIGHVGWVFELHENVTIQPFVEHTWQWLRTPSYTESGGPFPASYDSHNYTQNITRIGADLQWDVRPDLNLQLWLAFNHRYESEGPASSGEIIGWQPFYFSGSELKQNWGDTGFGLRWRFMDNTYLGFRLGFGIDNENSGLPDIMSTLSLSVDL